MSVKYVKRKMLIQLYFFVKNIVYFIVYMEYRENKREEYGNASYENCYVQKPLENQME